MSNPVTPAEWYMASSAACALAWVCDWSSSDGLRVTGAQPAAARSGLTRASSSTAGAGCGSAAAASPPVLSSAAALEGDVDVVLVGDRSPQREHLGALGRSGVGELDGELDGDVGS